ncbi:MAG: O-antigen ligase family protein [Candidatus Blackburnbacteria bacterium]|nr:O-antigen ligase family protein [Candidatus Blackburnbacteria bacterium]
MRKLLQYFNQTNILKYGLAAILLAIPIYPKFPLFNIPGTYVAVRAEDFLIFSLGFYWLTSVFRFCSKKMFRDELVQAMLLFFAVGLLSIVSAIFLTHSVKPHLGFFHWFRRVEYILPFFISLSAVWVLKRVKFFGETLFAGSLFVFIYGLGQIYLHWPVISTQNQEYAKGLALRWIPGARLHSTFGGHYDLAAFLVLLLPLAVAFFFNYKKWSRKLLLFVFSIVPSFWLLLKTESRVSFIAVLVGVSLTLWFLKKKIFIAPVLIISVGVALLFTGLGDRYKYSFETYWRKINSVPKINLVVKSAWAQTGELRKKEDAVPVPLEDRSTSIRLNMEWPRAIRAFLKNPLLGTGYSSITLATDNDYLRLLGEVGLVGSLAFFLVILRLFHRLCWFFRTKIGGLDRAFVAGFLGGFAGILINAIFIDVFEASKVAIIFWTLAGIAVGIVDVKEAKNG